MVTAFVLGLLTGSFLNLCICRIPEGESILYPPSKCSACGRRLKWHNMIPLISYVLLKGKCGFCGKGIPSAYPLVELMNGILYAAAFCLFDKGLPFIKSILLISIVIVASAIDLKEQIIPDGLIVFGLLTGIIFVWMDKSYSPLDALLGFIIGGGTLLIIALISKGGIGGGDIKLMAVIGVFLGWPLILIVLFISFVSGGIFGIVFLVTGKKGKKDSVPFGPFIGGASIISLFWGQWLISFYLSLF